MMDKGKDGLFTASAMNWDFDEERSLPTAWYGLARTLPAVLDESTVSDLQQGEWQMRQIATRAMAAQEAVGDLYLSTLLRADATLEAVDQITKHLQLPSGLPALEEFHRSQRTQFLTCLGQIAIRGATLILAQMR
jgi:hypothetical protein